MKQKSHNPVTPLTRRCPKCKADLRGPAIPKMWRNVYGKKTHFSRLVSIYDANLDRRVAWACPDCGAEFPRT